MLKISRKHLHAALMSLACLIPQSARAQDILENTSLYRFSDNSSRSAIVRSISRGGYELDDGRYQSFRDWYTTDIPDLSLLLITQASPDFAFIWGISTGERGPKYRINPALQLGFSTTYWLSPNLRITFTAIGLFGGNLNESSCYADYPPFGTYEVNCRLAASELPPEETLQYMMSVKAWRESTVNVQIHYQF